jgi:hypothetical protein
MFQMMRTSAFSFASDEDGVSAQGALYALGSAYRLTFQTSLIVP